MDILFMGTAAAEGVPALFCECEICKNARRTRGKEVRTRSGALIDGVLKLDFGPDSLKHMLDYGVDYTGLRSLLVTHTHEDHFSWGDISCRRRGFGQIAEGTPPLTVYGNAALGKLMARFIGDRLEFRQLTAFETVDIEGYAVTPLEAVHCLSSGPEAGWPVVFENRAYTRSEEAFFYLIEKDGKRLLYAHDTDEFTPADMEFLSGRRLDIVSLDCTNAAGHYTYIGHMGADDNLRMREKLIAAGAADEKTVFVANHFSHNGLVRHEEMEKLMPGFVVAYDGMRLSTEA